MAHKLQKHKGKATLYNLQRIQITTMELQTNNQQ